MRTWPLDGVLLGMYRAGNACFDLARSRDRSTLAVAVTTEQDDASSPATVTQEARDTTLSPGRARPASLAPTAASLAPGLRETEPRLRARYLVHDEHGRGGLGRVLRATDRELGRTVAVKELLRRDPVGEARFMREAMITARLEHPGIVPVHEAGRWEDGTPFYAMKLVDGRPLRELLREASDLTARLPLIAHIAAVADAVAYAHGRGIIHRDLKPANVIVGAFGEVIVIDWGLAKQVAGAPDTSDEPDRDDGPDAAGRAAADRELTHAGDVVGTPAYMAPEQARGDAVDERTDVYALGSMLYHVLGGDPPYHGMRSAEVLAAVRARAPEALPTEVPHELRAIVERAMARAPADRYPTARELAEDLRRFQTGKLVGAHSYRARELARRWLRRHRAPVAVAAVLLGVLAVLAVVSVRRIVAERDAAARAGAAAEVARGEAIARQHELLLSNARSALHRDPTESLAWLAQVPIDATTASDVRLLAADAISREVARHVFGGHIRGARGIGFLAGGKLGTADNDANVYIWDIATGKGTKVGALADIFFGSEVTPDGRFVVWSRAGDIRVFDPARGEMTLALDVPKPAAGLAAHPDGVRFAFADGTPRIGMWNSVTGEVQTLTTDVVRGVSFCFSPDGRSLAAGSEDGRLHLFDLERGTTRVLRGPAPGAVQDVQFSPDGRRLVTTAGDAVIRLWDVETGRSRELVGHDQEVLSLAFSADGAQLFSSSSDHAIRVWDLATGKSRQWLGHAGPAIQLTVSPDGRWLASADRKGGVRLWEVQTGQVRVLAGHRDGIMHLGFSPDGAWLASASKDDTARIWAVDQEAHRSLVGHDRPVSQTVFSRDGRWLVSSSAAEDVRHWDLATGRNVSVSSLTGAWFGLTLLADDRTVAAAYRTIRAVGPDGKVEELAPATTNSRLLQQSSRGELLVTDIVGKVSTLGPDGLTPRLDHGARLELLTELPDHRLVTAGKDQILRVWPDGASTPSAEYPFTGRVLRVDLQAGGLRAITVVDPVVTSTELETGRATELHGVKARWAGSAPDGRVLLTGHEGIVHVWTPATGAHLQLPHEGMFEAIFSADASHVFSCGEDGTVRTWTSAGVLVGMHRRGGACWGLELSPDGATLAVADHDGVIRLWPTTAPPLPADDAALHAYLATLTSAAVLSGDEIRTPP